MPKSPEELAHLEWLGYVQPVGLVVSVPAMLEAQCYVNKNIMAEHTQFLNCLPRATNEEIVPEIRDLAEFTQKVLGWEASDLITLPQHVPMPADYTDLEVVLPQYHETLRPTHVVPEFQPTTDNCQRTTDKYAMLVHELAAEIDLDTPGEADSARHWNAAPQAKFERLLRETGVPIGLLSNRRQLRLVYAPKGESSGYATFNVGEMAQVAGRPMFAALHMLLCADRMFSLGDDQRLPAILENSRKYQNTVSTKLAEQVLAALYELMRGFQAANDVTKGELLGRVLGDNPNHVYSGLLTVLMRLVFVMYAEDRDLLSSDPVYSNYYSVTGLFDRLRSDAGRFPDTMDQRFGAWSQLITVFRLIYEGAQHGDLKIPARKGYLFDPDRYPFLEGRHSSGVTGHSSVVTGEERAHHQGPMTNDQGPLTKDQGPMTVPRVSDGVIFRVLRNLLILDGERLSYRTLDVEQIGSVYETVMGFNLEVAEGKSIAIKPVKSHGAPATINLEALLETKGKDRASWLKEQSDQTLGTVAAKQLKEAGTIEELIAALDKKIAKKVTPRVVPAGAIVLQPSDERRRSGSHYTPRSLTEPIVRTTLEPILSSLVTGPSSLASDKGQVTKDTRKRLTRGEQAELERREQRRAEAAKAAHRVGTPHPSQILDLKICDPAMGSGAFLVETCRQLGDELIAAWYAHDMVPKEIPPDEDEVLYARRLVAQRCLYGVDKNPMAVDLAKLSLWLVTLAKDHPFTFLDHSLRHGDSLVGLSRRQIIGFHWEPKRQRQFGEELIQRRLDRATEARAKILNAREGEPYRDQEQRLALADEALDVIRLTGDACVGAFFAGSKKKQREDRCEELFASVSDWYASGHDPAKRGPIAAAAAGLRSGEYPIPPFHWEIEFPEVFSRENGGFDAFVGNPPFAGRTTLSNSNAGGYIDWLKTVHEKSHGNSDLVAHFFRRAFGFVRRQGTSGLVSTNTISQGDTRVTGLQWILEHDGVIYAAIRRQTWPGQAAVVVSIVHIIKACDPPIRRLNGRPVTKISAFLFHAGGDSTPLPLKANLNKSFQGCVVVGIGFTFDDTDTEGIATPIKEMHRLLSADPRNAERIFPYVGGQEVNEHPEHAHHRFIIHFGNRSLEEARKWPDLITIVESRVKPDREAKARQSPSSDKKKRAERWWQFSRNAQELYEAINHLERVLVCGIVSNKLAFTFLPTGMVYSHKLMIFALDAYSDFALLQSSVHDAWVRLFTSTMKDDLNYSNTDCFENFPFPYGSLSAMQSAGRDCFQFRAQFMTHSSQGLTKTYNRFHDPHEKSPDIQKLRDLHDAMDRAVLEAYGWDDLAKTARCEFLLDYEEEEEEVGSGPLSVGSGKGKKKPWRLRWPDDFRDEVLARLLELNEQRHKEELLAGKASQGKAASKTPAAGTSPKKTRKQKPRPDNQQELNFPDDD